MIKKLIRTLGVLAYLPLSFATLLGVLAPFIPVSWLPQVQLLPLFLLYTVPVHVLFLVFFIKSETAKSVWLLASLSLLGSCWGGFKDIRLTGGDASVEKELRIVSYNVYYFNRRQRIIDETLGFLKPLQPEVICFQEFWNEERKDGGTNLSYISEKLDLPYTHFATPWQKQGVAILSKYPISKVDTIYRSHSGANFGIFATLDTPKGKLGVGNLHLKSYSLKSTIRKQHSWQGKLKAFFHKASEVLPIQEQNVYLTLQFLENYPHPFLLAGDMNAVAHSRIVHLFSRKYTESFTQSGQGIGWTYPIIRPLGIRIDYLFCAPQLKPVSHRILKEGESDHYPIVVDYQFQ